MKQNKIIFVINDYGFYKTHRKELLDFLSQGNEVHLITNMKGVKKGLSNAHHLDIGRRSMNIFNNLLISYKLFQIIGKIKPTHIFYVSFKPMALGILPSIFLSNVKKYLVFSGLGYAFINSGFRAKLAKAVIMIFLYIYKTLKSKFIFQNLDDLKSISKSLEVDRSQCEIIAGNGIDPTKFKSKIKEETQKKITFLFVGRLLIDKGIEELIRAIELVGDRANFILISPEDPENHASLELERVAQLSKKENVVLHQKLNHKDVKNIFTKADIFILPSYREGLPRAALEAMCSKLPVILTDVPGCRECVIHNENGFMVQPQNAESLVEAINKFIQNPNMIKKMGLKSYQIVEEKFSNGKIFQQYLELL